MKKLILIIGALVMTSFILTSESYAQTCEIPTSCAPGETNSCTNVIQPFPCWTGTEPIYDRTESLPGTIINQITADDTGLIGSKDMDTTTNEIDAACGANGDNQKAAVYPLCKDELIIQSPNPALPVKGFWWRMHDHEDDLTYQLYVCRQALVNGNCPNWGTSVQNAEVHTSGDDCGYACSGNQNAHAPFSDGNQGCQSPIPNSKYCQADNRVNWTCAVSYDEHVWAAPSCGGQAITAVKLVFGGENGHVHLADSVWVFEGTSCTIQGFKMPNTAPYSGGTITLKDASGQVLETTTDEPYFFTNLPSGRNYTVEATGPDLLGSTLCVNSTLCHTINNSAFLSGASRQVVNCPANGYVDLWWHYGQAPTPTRTLTPTRTPTRTPTPTITTTPTPIPPMCRQDVSLTLPAAPTPAPDMSLKLRVKFQGVLLANIANEAWKTQPVKVTVIKQVAAQQTGQGAQTVFSKSFDNVQVKTTGEADARGIAIWEGTFTASGVAAGENYSVLVKGPKHLQRKFCVQNPTDRAEEGFPYRCLGAGTLSLGPNVTLDFASVLLQAGDLPGGTAEGQDGIVNAYDVSLILNMIRDGQSEQAADLVIADMDLNGVVNAKDRSYLIETLEEKYGDEE